jgi:hypothetical protein
MGFLKIEHQFSNVFAHSRRTQLCFCLDSTKSVPQKRHLQTRIVTTPNLFLNRMVSLPQSRSPTVHLNSQNCIERSVESVDVVLSGTADCSPSRETKSGLRGFRQRPFLTATVAGNPQNICSTSQKQSMCVISSLSIISFLRWHKEKLQSDAAGLCAGCDIPYNSFSGNVSRTFAFDIACRSESRSKPTKRYCSWHSVLR